MVGKIKVSGRGCGCHKSRHACGMNESASEISLPVRISVVFTLFTIAAQFVIYVDAFLGPGNGYPVYSNMIIFRVKDALNFTKFLSLGALILWGFHYIARRTHSESDTQILTKIRRTWIISLSVAWIFYLTVLIYNLLRT